MDLFDLDDLIFDLRIDPTDEQLDFIFSEFERDFIINPLVFKGYQVKVVLAPSTIDGFEGYPETFVHLITRKGKMGIRRFDRHRANKIHYIRCILEHHDDENITYFEYPESDGKLREYYWYKDEDFLVIMQRITPDYVIVTSFHVDDAKNRKYFEERLNCYKKQR